jgi:hypothetical protein
MLFLVWAGAGRLSLDELLRRRIGVRSPVDESSRFRHASAPDT